MSYIHLVLISGSDLFHHSRISTVSCGSPFLNVQAFAKTAWEEKANVGSQYWMKLGSDDYHGVAVCAACASGNISALKSLGYRMVTGDVGIR